MRRIASTAKHATSRTPTRTSRGFLLRAAAGQTIRTCEGVFTRIPGRRCRTADFVVSLPRHQSSESQCARLFVRRNFPENRGGTADPKPNSPQRRCLIGPGRHDAALIPAFKGGGHARSGQLLRAGPKQFILLNAAAPRAFVRQMESTVILSPSLRRAAMAAMAALVISWPAVLCARAQQPRENFSRTSPAGSYLAARHAGGQRDAAAAAAYYRAALRGDPRNNELLGRTFLAVLANGEIDEGVKLAERVLQVDKNDRIARLVLGVRAIKQKQYPVARRELAQSIRGPITDLAATLLSAWTQATPAEYKASI